MIRKKFVPLMLAFLCLFSTLKSQVTTNRTALQEASLRTNNRYLELNKRLLTLARHNNWPLSLKLRNGGRSLLVGLDRKGLPIYLSTNNNTISAATIGTNQLWPGGTTGLNLNGSTAALKGKIAIWDGGKVLGTHQELTGRVIQKDNATDVIDHATHVSGTMIASGVNPLAKGMSFGAQQLQAYDFENDVSEMYSAAPGLLVSNHSYGWTAAWEYDFDNNRWVWYGVNGDTADYKLGYYDDYYAKNYDSIAYLAPDYLMVIAAGNIHQFSGPAVGQPYYGFNSLGVIVSRGNRPAGISSNDGFDVITPPATAKNVISVGAVNPIPGGYTNPASVVLADFSSWGPTDDGRIKPEVVSDGVSVLSSVSTSNSAYAIFSGTSQATPAVSGSAFLLQELYYKMHNSFMRSATLKGILIHTTDEAGPADGPDYQYGYGLVDIPKAASVISSNNTDQFIQENLLTNAAGTYTFSIIASGKSPVKATICWTDPPGDVDSVITLNDPKPRLVNDLDLRVTGNGNTYTPWILNRLIPWNPATHGDDTVNNVEKIEIPNPVPGRTYTITVTHKGNLRYGSQAYSLLVSGGGSAAYCLSAATSSAGTRIDQVTINSQQVNNPPGTCTTYTDNTSHTLNIKSNQAIPFSINLNTCDASNASRVVKIFIDYNNNGTFTDSGEMVSVSPVLAGGILTYSGNLNIPLGIKVGTITLMRIVAEETTDTSLVKPCGSYPNGETEDFTLQFIAPANDIGVRGIIDPLSEICASDSQRISINIQNNGTSAQSNFPIQLKVSSGNNTLINTTTFCPDTLAVGGNLTFTFQPAFNAVAGQKYTVISSTALSGDQDTTNDTFTDTISVSAGNETVTGNAEICGSNPAQAGLKANIHDSTDAVLWYASPTATVPIASGYQATTTTIPANKTYYLGLNEISSTIGPKTKLAYPSGGYNFFQGNFIKFHNDVPLTISTARLYIGYGHKINVLLADIFNYDSCTGSYSYLPSTSTDIDVYPTTPTPFKGATSVNTASDTGAVFLLNLLVPTAGDHILIVTAEDSTFIFRNNNITTPIYPMGIPGIFTILSNSAINTTNCKDTGFYQKYYYFFYDIKVTLEKCASPRVAVVANTPLPVIISKIGNNLSSNYASGNQWYFDDTLQAGSTAQTFNLRGTGNYKDVVTDSVGCVLISNEYIYAPGNDIGLAVLPNPNHGQFTLEFYQAEAANTALRIMDMNGRKIYESNDPNFKGSFNRSINLGAVSKGMYVLQLVIGDKKYLHKIIVY